jgi:hypothetical protein
MIFVIMEWTMKSPNPPDSMIVLILQLYKNQSLHLISLITV